MSLLKTSLESSPITIPFKVRMEPYLVESLCDLARLTRDKGLANSDVGGLLFGKAEPGVRSIEALKTFVDTGSHSELARRQRWEKAYKATAEEARLDLELSQFEIIGWFSFRTASGLLSSDLVFHNQHFRKAEDIALIVCREGPSQLSAEVYAKSENDVLTSDDYRWGTVRLSADIRHMRESIELAMRVKLSEDSYLRTYESEEPLSHFEALKRRAEAVSDKLFGFLNRGKEEEYNEKIRGLIGDGRLPGRARPPADGADGPPNGMASAIGAIEEPLPNPQAYFNPYSELGTQRKRSGLDEFPKPSVAPPPAGPTPAPPRATPAPFQTAQPAPAPPPAEVVWPGSGSGFGTAPARVPDYSADFRFPEPEPPPLALPSPGIDMDLAQIGRSPRTGRAVPSEVGGLPMLLRPPASPKASPWPWVVGVFLLCSGLVFGFLALGGLQGENGRLGQIFQAVFPSNGLDLRVRNEDDRLRLSWNQRNHAVASATDATLQIFDGQLSREVHLDGRQVADGSVLYRPLNNDITFRLVVRGDQGSANGSVRVLDGLSSRLSTLDVSSAVQNPSRSPYEPPLTGDPTAPTLLRDGQIPPADSTASNVLPHATPPTSESPIETNDVPVTAYVPPGKPAVRSSVPKPLPPHYETPETIGTIPAADQTPASDGDTAGVKINGWDPVPVPRAKAKARVQPPGTAGFGDATGSTYIAPHPLVQVMPNVRNIPVGTLSVRTRVTVKVSVDSSGRVTNARVTGTGVNAKVAAVAISAAKQWMFDPAKENGRRISSEHTIVFVLPAR
jgi:TonB family protein